MEPIDQENSLQDIRADRTGIIWKERDDEWITKILEADLTRIPITQGERYNPKESEPKDGGSLGN